MPNTNSIQYIDLQVNGFGGVDFNQNNLTAEQLNTACLALQKTGVHKILATIITDSKQNMLHRIQQLTALRNNDPLATQIIHGLHIEGPFINPETGYVGAHPPDAVIPPSIDLIKQFNDHAQGLIKLITLAPELDPNMQTIKWLADNNIIIAAGHCNPSIDELHQAINAGLNMFTHLGNGCPINLHRHDNIIQRVLHIANLYPLFKISFIPDGVHIPFFALENYISQLSTDQYFFVTDAIAPASLGPGNYTLGRWNLKIENDMVARAPDGSHLVGSAITMPQIEHNLINHLRLNPHQIKQTLHHTPANLLQIL